jgi:hypothetical protein
VIGKAEGVLSALGLVLTEAVIPALTWVYQQSCRLDRVQRHV